MIVRWCSVPFAGNWRNVGALRTGLVLDVGRFRVKCFLGSTFCVLVFRSKALLIRKVTGVNLSSKQNVTRLQSHCYHEEGLWANCLTWRERSRQELQQCSALVLWAAKLRTDLEFSCSPYDEFETLYTQAKEYFKNSGDLDGNRTRQDFPIFGEITGEMNKRWLKWLRRAGPD